jgi:hypothetical protein
MLERFTYIGSAYLFLIKDGQVLLQRRYNIGFEDGNYGVQLDISMEGRRRERAVHGKYGKKLGLRLNQKILRLCT